MEIQYVAYRKKVEPIKLQTVQRSFYFRSQSGTGTQTAANTKEVSDSLPWMSNPKHHANPVASRDTVRGLEGRGDVADAAEGWQILASSGRVQCPSRCGGGSMAARPWAHRRTRFLLTLGRLSAGAVAEGKRNVKICMEEAASVCLCVIRKVGT